MIYGYARVSTYGQAQSGNSIESQIKTLKEAGAKTIFTDVASGKKSNRPKFQQLINTLESGDKLVVTKLDRFARSIIDGVTIIENLVNRGVTVEVIGIGTLDNSPQAKLIRNIMFSFAEFERELINERMQEGKAIAKQKPGYREGRPRKYDKERLNAAMELLKNHSYKKVEAMTGISVSTLQRERKRKKNNF